MSCTKINGKFRKWNNSTKLVLSSQRNVMIFLFFIFGRFLEASLDNALQFYEAQHHEFGLPLTSWSVFPTAECNWCFWLWWDVKYWSVKLFCTLVFFSIRCCYVTFSSAYLSPYLVIALLLTTFFSSKVGQVLEKINHMVEISQYGYFSK